MHSRDDQSDEHFDIPAENIQAAIRHQADRARPRNVRVPSRTEVATLPLEQLHRLLFRWFHQSAIEIIPGRKQVAAVQEILRSRADITRMPALLALCEAHAGKTPARDRAGLVMEQPMSAPDA